LNNYHGSHGTNIKGRSNIDCKNDEDNNIKNDVMNEKDDEDEDKEDEYENKDCDICSKCRCNKCRWVRGQIEIALIKLIFSCL